MLSHAHTYSPVICISQITGLFCIPKGGRDTHCGYHSLEDVLSVEGQISCSEENEVLCL